jgi:hypothetical protein
MNEYGWVREGRRMYRGCCLAAEGCHWAGDGEEGCEELHGES